MHTFKHVSSQANPAELDQEVLAFWREHDTFKKSQEKTKNGVPYVIFDGPPTANAAPGLHHMIPGSFKDVAGRYNTMAGRYVRRQAGWDTHGLPVEVQVEKAMGLAGKKDILKLVPGDESASIRTFNEACRNSVWEFKKEWETFIEREGYWQDLENPYITYSPEYVEGVWGVFKQVWEKDLVFKDYKVVPYCPRCGTGLSAAEVALEYQDRRDVSVYVSFPIDETRSLLAWTTTPWTLPGHVGLAVHPEMTYVVVRQEGGREYILAKSRLSVLKGEYEIVEEMKGKALVGLKYQPPYPGVMEDNGKAFMVYPAAFVTDSDGSGIVHTAVMYGEDDFNLGKEVGLPRQHTVGLDGCFLPHVTGLAGVYVQDALGTILTHLKETNRLYAKETITHSYPHCWRCKTPLLYYAKDSWYIAVSTIRDQLVANNETVDWVPSHVRDGRFGDFIRQARDWAISRERFWGTPLPIWTSEDGEFLCVGSVEELRSLALDPTRVPADFDPHRPFVDEVVLVKDGKEFRREPFVMDVWFDSGAMPYASGREGLGEFPADYIAEAVDQTRGWFYTLMVLGTILKKQSPYKRVVCMGHLVDEHGKKMSKSGPNRVDPDEMMTKVGTDALRWFYYTVNSPGEAKSFSVKEVQVGYRKSLLLVWNMVSYFTTYANLAGINVPSRTYEKEDLSLLDRWVLNEQARTAAQLTEFMEAADFMNGGRLLETYIGDLSTWYLRRSRKRTDTQFFMVFYDILVNVLTMLAPFTPFTTEYLYKLLEAGESVHLADWIQADSLRVDAVAEAEMKMVRAIVEMGLSLRSSAGIKVRQPLASAFAVLPQGGMLSEEAKSIIADELNVQEVMVVPVIADGHFAQTDGLYTVALDTELTEALIAAGDAREVLRQLQNLRKHLGLTPGQMATLTLNQASHAELAPVLASILADTYLRVEVGETAQEYEVSLGDRTYSVGITV